LRIAKTFSVITVFLALAAHQAQAATNGSLGATSTATTVITLTIPETLRISGMGDLSLGRWSGSGAMSANRDVCVYDNSSNGSYHVTATGNSTLTPSAFGVQNSNASYGIPFSVTWNNGAGTSGSYGLTYNKSHSASGANTRSMDCSVGGKSSNLGVSFASTNLQKAPGGVYSTTLTVMVEP
jgi:hypothetical protein